MTRQRKIIYDIVRRSDEHLTAEQIYIYAKKQVPSIAIGTVYRNLKLMSDAGEIRRVEIPDSPDRYDKNLAKHDHLICEKCGRISDITLEDFTRAIEEQTGVRILFYHLSVHCICDECRKASDMVLHNE